MSNENYATELLGKKVFFLYPSAIVQNSVIAELIQQEFEVYIVRDHTALRRVLRHHPNSIVFADIDEHMPERDWEAWIRGIMSVPETQSTSVGVISAKDDEALQRKYVNMVKVQCGYTAIKSDINNSIRQICEILKNADAKGRRKYIRAIIESDSVATMNLPMNGTFINGSIKDISVVGVSCTFDNDPGLVKNALFRDIQIKLQGMLLNVEGIVFGSRMDGQSKIYVLLLTQRIDPEVKIKIRKYMQHNLQSKMDAELKQPV